MLTRENRQALSRLFRAERGTGAMLVNGKWIDAPNVVLAAEIDKGIVQVAGPPAPKPPPVTFPPPVPWGVPKPAPVPAPKPGCGGCGGGKPS